MKSEGKKVNKTAFVVALAAGIVIIATAFALAKPSPMGNQMSHGVNIAYHYHVTIDFREYGGRSVLPAGIGLESGIWFDKYLDGEGPPGMAPIHTHGSDNLLHIEPREYKVYSMADFFRIWGEDPVNFNVCYDVGGTCAPITDLSGATLLDSDKYRIERK